MDDNLPSIPDDQTPAESLFLVEFMDNDKSIEEAAYLAWPESRQPIMIAKALLQSTEYVRARFHTYMDLYHLSDKDIAYNLSEATRLAKDEDTVKQSAALLNATKESAKLKNLYAPPPTPPTIREQIGDGMTQFNIVNQYLQTAKDAGLTEADIEHLTESPIIDVETIKKEDLFDTQ